jgi:hypothetical protein
LGDEKVKLEKDLGMSQYLCQKLDEDLKNSRQEKASLLRSTVRIATS